MPEESRLNTDSLTALSVRELKGLMNRAGISWKGCVEKTEMVDRIMKDCGREIEVRIKSPVETISIVLPRGATVLQLKEAIRSRDRVPTRMQRLILGEKELMDDSTLLSLGIDDDVLIRLAVDINHHRNPSPSSSSGEGYEAEGTSRGDAWYTANGGGDVFKEGVYVEVVGLTKAARYNGKLGLIRRDVDEKGRCAVEIMEDPYKKKMLNIRAVNMRVSKKRPKKTKSKSMADKLRRAFRSTNAFRVEDPVAAVRFLEANNPNSIAKPAARTLLSVLQKLQRRPDDHRSRNLSFAPLIHRKFITGVRGAADILHLAGYTEKKDGMPSYTLAKFKPKRVSAVIAALKSGIARMRSIAAPMKKASLSDIGALAMGDIKQIREIFEEKKSGITEEAPSLEAQEDEGGVFGVGGEGKASRARGKIREMAEGVSLAVRKAREAKSSLGQKLGTFTFGYWGQVVPLSQCPGDHAEIIRQVRKLTGGLATGDEVPHGYGIAIDPLGSTYEGQFHYGKPEGYGRRRLVVGVTQEGEFQNGELEGFGRQLNADENGRPAAFKYVGSFKKGNKSGYAEFSGPNGLLYKGEYLNNDFHGLGFMTRSNGKHEYYGEYKNGQNEGVGVLTEGAERTKIKYWGQFKLGVPHGHGVTSKGANDDEVYEGQFFGGMQHRSGVLKVNHPQEADGPFVLYGGFKQGQPHGYGSVLFGGNVKSFRGKVFRQPVSGASMRFNKGAMEETDQHEVPMVSKAIENARKAQQQAQRFKAEALRAAARAKAKVEKESLTVSTPATKEEKTASQWRQHLQAAKRKIRALRAFKDGRKLSEKRKQSCAECGRKLGIFGFECRCLRKFCEKHRLPASHACPFDMKRFHRNRLKSESEKLQTNRGLEDVI